MDLFALRVVSMQLRHLLTVDEAHPDDGSLPPKGEVAFSSTGEFLFASRSSMSIFRWTRLLELFRRGDDLPGVRIVPPLGRGSAGVGSV